MTRLAVRPVERQSVLLERLRSAGPPAGDAFFGVVAPLRICPLGAHVDHQGGMVTGLTVDRSVALVGAASADPRIEISSLDFSGQAVVDLRNPAEGPVGDWADYARAAASALSRKHRLGVGLRAVLGGDLPGAGLSSSAAVLITFLMAMARVNQIDLAREEIAALVQRAENDFMGVASGRLDQSIILFAEPGALTRVNCATLEVGQVRPPAGASEASFLVAFSGMGRTLVGSDFNLRVAECRQAASKLLELGGARGLPAAVLSGVSPEIFEEFGPALPEKLGRRARHYFGEQQRVTAGIELWRKGDLEGFGRLMTASGASSIEDYECGTPELTALWQALHSTEGVLGARFSGAGFGGSCIALIAADAAADVVDRVHRVYAEAHPGPAGAAAYHLCKSDGPARLLGRVG